MSIKESIKKLNRIQKTTIILMATGIGAILISVSTFGIWVNNEKPTSPQGSPTSGNTESSGFQSNNNSFDGKIIDDVNSVISSNGSSSSSQNTTPVSQRFIWPMPNDSAKSEIKMVNGMPRVFINNTQIPPIMFFGNTDINGRYDVLAEEVKKTAKGNIHFYSMISSPEIGSNQPNEVKYFDLDNDLDVIIDNDPNAFILLRVNVGKYYDTSSYPESDIVKYARNKADYLPMVSIASDRWLSETKQMLTDMVTYIRCHPKYSKHVVGYHLDCGEWFQYMFRENGVDISLANTTKYRVWLTNKYKTDSALQKAWNMCTVTLNTAKVPQDLPGNISGISENKTLLLKACDQRFVDYLDYIGDHVSTVIAELSKTIKDTSNRENIVIAFYGYLFELADAQSGHYEFETLLKNNNIDGFSSPECYLDRNISELFPNKPSGSTGAYMSPVDSVQRAGKMWFVESDQRSFINRPNQPTENDSYLVPAQSVWEMEELAKRDIGSAMLRGASIWLMDLWAVGWLDDQAIWDTSGKLGGLYQAYANSRKSMSSLDVAFVVDQDAQSLVAQPTDSSWHSLSYQRYDLYRAGISFGMYSLGDLISNNMPDSKVIFILNPFRLSASQVDKILIASKGKTVVFSYGFGTTSSSDISRLTGMDIRTKNKKLSVLVKASTDAAKFGLSANGSWGADVDGNPRYYVNSGYDFKIGTYSDGKVAFAAKNLGTHKAVFFGGMRMSTEVIRAIMKYSGVHVFTDSDDVSMANENLYIIHSSKAGIKTINFAQKVDVYDYFKDQWYMGVSAVQFSAEYGETRYFFYGSKKDIEDMKLPKW